MMRLHAIWAVLLGTGAVLCAADFWLTQDAAQWSEKQIRQMATDSPWAREANVSLKGLNLPLASRNAPGRRAPGPLEEQPGVSGRPSGGYAEASDRAMPTIVVRWESATPVSEACAKGGMDPYLFSCTSKLLYLSGLAQKFTDLAREFYIVSMSNYPNLAGEGKAGDAPQHSAAANAALESLAHSLQQTTFLRRGTKTPIQPAHAVALPAGRVLLIIFFFPRTEPISLADKEIGFTSSNGAMDVKTKFSLQKMVFRGRLDL